MDILKRGIPPQERVYIADCNRCNSKLRFTAQEARHINDQLDGDCEEVVCPVCNSRVTKSSEDYEK